MNIGGVIVGVRPEGTPNPNAVKFTSDKIIFEGENSIYILRGDVSEHEIMNKLMQLVGVDNVFGYQNFITVNKLPEAEWDDLIEPVIELIEGYGF